MRIAGIDVTVDWSLLIIYALIATSLASGLFPEWHPDWPPLTAWLTALAAATLFFASVLLHELSHSLVGRLHGIEVRRITLFVFGGMAQMEQEPQRWTGELWMAIAGPLMSLALGIGCALASGIGAHHGALGEAAGLTDIERLLAGLGPGRTLLLWLGQVNIVLALFNLVPAFPLDGGRMLRALMWGATHDLRRSTRWASVLGQGFARLLIGSGLAMMLGGSLPYLGGGAANGIWLAFIGWFLNNAARVSYRQVLTRELLQGVPVGRLMQTRFQTVPADLPLETLRNDYLGRGEQRAFPVLEHERMIGMVCQRDVERPGAAHEARTVREAMRPLAEVTAVRLGDDAMDVLALLAHEDLNQVPVIEDGRVLGFVRRADILRWLAARSAPSARGR